MISCGATKPIVHSPPSSETKTEEVNSAENSIGKMDTVLWTEIDRSDEYEDALEAIKFDKQDSYKISLLMPLEIENNNIEDIHEDDSKLGRMTHYYAGIKMALSQLEKEGIALDVDVMDIESGNFESKLRRCKDSDVIIGPRDTDQLSTVANYGKINEIPVISPWKSGSKISQSNPYFIQLKTSLRAHFQKIIADAKSQYQDDQIILLGRKDRREDANYIRYLQTVAQSLNNDQNSKPLKEFYLEEDSLIIGETAFDSTFNFGSTTCFILPHWSFSTDEDFVYNAARKLSGEKGLERVVLYGMPILYESEKIKFELYRNLNMRICRSTYVDKDDPSVKDFRIAYFKEYNDFPTDDALEAYDMMIFIGRSLFNYGKKFQYFIDT